MVEPMHESDGVAEGVDTDEVPTVTAHECSDDRTVFTESDNTDGWIATDFVVDVPR